MKNLSILRENAGFTQENLAKMLGVDRSAIAKWETGEAMPRSDKLPDLAEALSCNIDDLFGWKSQEE